MTTYHRKRGDQKDTLVITLDGSEDLTDVTTIAVNVARRRVTKDAASLTGTVLDAAARTIAVDLDSGSAWMDTARGTYRMTETVTFSDGRIFTWPSKGHDTLIIGERAT